MIKIFDYADEDGDHIVARVAHSGDLCVEAFPVADSGGGCSVFIPAADVRRFAAALAQHWPAFTDGTCHCGQPLGIETPSTRSGSSE